MEKDQAYELMQQGQNIFLTGKAGTGKSTLLRRFRNNSKKNVVVIAPTGVAALTAGGMTIHSFFLLPPRFIYADDIRISRNTDKRTLIRQIDVLIIDEAAMVRADLFHAVDASMRCNRGNDSPFGGAQVILVGDLFQLPPVYPYKRQEREAFQSLYNSPWFFESESYKNAEFRIAELTTVYRQNDPVFLDMLNSVRAGTPDINAFNRRHDPYFKPDEHHITLVPTNALAEKINNQALDDLDKEPHTFYAKITGKYKEKDAPAPAELTLKVGAHVMFVKNDSDHRWVNGTIGIVKCMRSDSVNVSTASGNFSVKYDEWEMFEYVSKNGKIAPVTVGEFKQLPLRLAWAVTIHKSQGQTYDNVILDTGEGMFAHGQFYTAVSRCTSLDGLTLLKQMKSKDVIIDPAVLNFARNTLDPEVAETPTYELWDFQAETDAVTRKELIEFDNCLIVGPCGCGKTMMFSFLVMWITSFPGRRVVILLDRTDLVLQTAQTIQAVTGIKPGIVCSSASKTREYDNRVVVASRQTFISVLEKTDTVNLLILDEAHLVDQESGQYHQIITHLKEKYPPMRYLGYTATPSRDDGPIYGPTKIFKRISHQILASDLTRDGYIVPLRWKVKESDVLAKLDACKLRNGEIVKKTHREILSTEIFIQSVFTVWKELCEPEKKKTVIFAVDIKHAKIITDFFISQNVRASVIHSRMKSTAVQDTVKAFRTNDDLVLVNVGILTIGSDIPEIEAIFLARRVSMPPMFFQIIGRGTRLCDAIRKRECLIIDLCGSVFLHGTNPDVYISAVAAKKKPTDRLLQLCPRCEILCSLNTRICKCGFVFPVPENPEVTRRRELAEKKAAGKIIDFDPEAFLHTVACDKCLYSTHRSTSPLPTVRIRFYSEGREVVNKWTAPQHPERAGEMSRDLWKRMGGKPEAPKTVAEWLRRSGELNRKNKVLIDFSGKYPQFKKVIYESDRP